jgi:inward rectifier potassium channel
VRIGLTATGWHDLYHSLLTLSWWEFLLGSLGLYLVVNALFGALYLIQPGSIANARPGAFLDAFFFSVQTFATVGYGQMYPATTYANWVMTFESYFGLISVAVGTGMVFARISRPTARVIFSNVAVIAMHDGQPTLMIRMGNERTTQIVDATVTLSALRGRRSKEGHFMWRFHDLKLVRARTPVFSISFTAMHIIDEHSPLFGLTGEAMAAEDLELLVTVTGLEESLGSTVHASMSYEAKAVLPGQRYIDVVGQTGDGRWGVDFGKFDLTEPDPFA